MERLISLAFLVGVVVFSSWTVPAVVAQEEDTPAASLSCFEDDDVFTSENDWEFCQPLQSNMLMYYTPQHDDGTVKLGLHALDTFGWTALAIAGNGGMKGASQIVVRKAENEEWVAEDRNSMDYVMPELDESQDVRLLWADQTEDGETKWAVELPMNSCDENDYPIQNVSKFMHYAVGESHTFSFHGNRRGQFHANLMNAPQTFPESTDNYVDVRMPDVDVVLGEGGTDPTNAYICSYFDMLELIPSDVTAGEVVHVTKMEALLNPESAKYVHHMILYSCDAEALGGSEQHHDLILECESMPPGCQNMKWPWAVGSEPIVLPPHVGIPFGEQGQRFLVLQTHYYNPTLDTGIVDSSGVRVFYTTDLREQEAGVITLNSGTGNFQRPPIPVGMADYPLSPTFVYPSACTQNTWQEPLNILGVGHHMHLSGKRMEIAVERDGSYLGLLRNEHHYDFNHQSAEEPLIQRLYPGDQLTLQCWYDTTGRSEETSFGDLTQNEMCFAVMLYYPRQTVQDFGYLPLFFDPAQCLEPASDPPAGSEDIFEGVSACAQNYYEDMRSFFNMNMMGMAYNESSAMDAVSICNSDEYVNDIMPVLPLTCPGCYQNKDCTISDIVQYGQTAVCPFRCANDAGVSVWPNLDRTEAFDQQVYGCISAESSGDSMEGFNIYPFTTPQLLEAPACEAVGTPLTSFEDEDDGGSSSCPGQANLHSAGFAFAFILLMRAWY